MTSKKADTATITPAMFAASGPQLTEWAAAGDADAQAELDRRAAKRAKSGKAARKERTPEQQARDEAYKAMSPEQRKAHWAEVNAAKAAKKAEAKAEAAKADPPVTASAAPKPRVVKAASKRPATRATKAKADRQAVQA